MAHFCAAATGPPGRSAWGIIPPPLTALGLHHGILCWQGLKALIGLRDVGVDGLKRWLTNRGEKARVEYRSAVIRALFTMEESRDEAIRAAVQLSKVGHLLLDPVYEIAAESDDLAIREKVLEVAFSTSAVVVNAPLDAIRDLAKFDSDRAAEAIQLGLSNHPKIERQLCRLLVRLEPELAAEKLLGAAISLERDSLIASVGRALRRSAPKPVTDAVLRCLSGSETERKIGSKVAGWLAISEIIGALEQAADRESSIAVRRAALDALYQHREEEAVRGLYSEFQSEQCTARRWSFFIAILETADPYLLSDPEDVLWLGRLLTDDVPFALERYARETLRRRKQKRT